MVLVEAHGDDVHVAKGARGHLVSFFGKKNTQKKVGVAPWKKKRTDAMGPNVDFAKGRLAVSVRRDASDMTVDQIHAELFDDFEILESSHTYIQFLFPTDVPSKFNPASVALTPTEAQAIARSLPACLRLLFSLIMMLRFYGFSYADGEIGVDETRMPERLANMKRAGHNKLRITRILRSLVLLGCRRLARTWLAHLETLVGTVYGEAKSCLETYWRAAVEDTPGVEWPRSNALIRVETNDPLDVARLLCGIVRSAASPSSFWALRRQLRCAGVATRRFLIVGIASPKRTFVQTPLRARVVVADLRGNACKLVPIKCLGDVETGCVRLTVDAITPSGGLAIYSMIRASCAYASNRPCFCVEQSR